MTKLSKKRRLVLTLIFVAINVAVIAATAINEFGNSANAAELSEVKIQWWLLVPATLIFVVSTFLNVLKYVLMIKKTTDRNQHVSNREIWKIAFRVLMLGSYYDCVTPAAIGGQPFQIYYMHKHGKLEPGRATSVPIFSMITGQVGFLIVAFFFLVSGEFFREKPELIVASAVGFGFYAFWPVIVAGTTFFPKATSRFLQFFVKVLARLRLVKNREAKLKRVEKEAASYADSVKMFLKSKGMSISVLCLAVAHNFLSVTIPYFVLKAFGGNMDFFQCCATVVAVKAAVYFVPTPGNSGAMEGTFYAVFSSLSTGYIFWAMLVWRFFSYYIYIIAGPLIYLRMHMEKRRTTLTSKTQTRDVGECR